MTSSAGRVPTAVTSPTTPTAVTSPTTPTAVTSPTTPTAVTSPTTPTPLIVCSSGIVRRSGRIAPPTEHDHRIKER
jgi:hypothetical protein